MASSVPVLTFHSLDDGGSAISTSPTAFRGQMQRLRDRGFQCVALREVLDAWDGRGELPPQPLALTFDDGFRNVGEVAAPTLRALGFRATLFVVADYCGRTNAWPGQPAGIPILPLLSHAELRVLAAAGFEIGAHGATHARLDRLSAAAAEQEIAGSRRRLEDGLGQSVTAFAYPYGRADAFVRRCAAAHYRAACSDELRTAASDDDRHWLGRLDMYYFRGGLPLRLLGTAWGDRYAGLRRLGRRTKAAAHGLGSALRFGRT